MAWHGKISLLVLTVAFCLISITHTFYVPGIAPVEFKKGDHVEVKAVKMTSSRTQLPYEYYSLAFCSPHGDIVYNSLNLGEVLRGDRIVNTPYNVSMNVNQGCVKVCEKRLLKADIAEFKKRIMEDYFLHLLVDNLPAATKLRVVGSSEFQYNHGYLLGFMKKDKAYLNNHLKLVLKYHSDDGLTFRVVGFEVIPLSVSTASVTVAADKHCKLAEGNSLQPLEIVEGVETQTVTFTYEVEWESSEIRWASRWDIYLAMSDVHIHWFSIVNSLVIVVFLTGILGLIMLRVLKKDIVKYNSQEDKEDMLEESGWKLVHGDVLRPPPFSGLFCVLVASGVQLFLMLFLTTFFAMLGMLSPASRGALMTAGICSYVGMGLFSGFFAGRLYKTLRGQHWRQNAIWTAMLVPGVVLGGGFCLNVLIWGKGSSGAVPFGSMVVLAVLWLGVSLPLTFLGAYFGYRKAPYSAPVKVNQIARAVPPQQWFHNPCVCLFVAGILPFGALFIELFFIFTAIWDKQVYYMFGFLFVVFMIMTVSVSQISMVLTYFQLCAEDYRWWWKTLFTSGGTAVYMFFYSVFYFFNKLEITNPVPTCLYFGYSFLMCFVVWILTGTIGFYASYLFIRKIYSAIKIE